MTKATQLTKMNNLLIQHKNILYTKLKKIESELNRNRLLLENYEQAEFEPEYKNLHMRKLSESIKIYESEKDILELKIIDVEKGNLDIDLQLEFEKNRNDTSVRDKLKIQKKREDSAKKQKSYSSMVSQNQEERKNLKQTNYEIKKAFYHFSKVDDTLPEKLQNNLENMPMNKGYKFKDVIFFGKLPSTDEDYIIFERINKDTMYIHLWEKNFIYLYEKKGKDKKVLIEKIPRKSKSKICVLNEFFEKL
jgi:hypothetical protein